MKIRAHIIISGRVHGVGFRANARRMAIRLMITGWVRNLPDGSVEALAEGEEKAVKEFVNWCRKGPSLANVSDIKINWLTATDEFKGFHVKR